MNNVFPWLNVGIYVPVSSEISDLLLFFS